MNWRIFPFFLTLSVLSCAQGKEGKKDSAAPDDGDDAATDPNTDKNTDTGSGSETATETGTDTGTGVKTPVLAFFGGYTSCGTSDSGDPSNQDLKTFFDATQKALEKKSGVEPKFMLTCFTLAYESVRYRMSGEDGVKDKLIAGMEADFEDLIGTIENPEVLLVGHSYGAWTAMDVALKLPPGVKLKGLVTLDPISHEDCVTNDVIASGFEPVPGCTRAPTDFGQEKIQSLSESTEWLNYYQEQVSFLHSGEIKGAKNFKRQYDGTGFQPHNGFLFDDAIGQEILTLVDHAF